MKQQAQDLHHPEFSFSPKREVNVLMWFSERRETRSLWETSPAHHQDLLFLRRPEQATKHQNKLVSESLSSVTSRIKAARLCVVVLLCVVCCCVLCCCVCRQELSCDQLLLCLQGCEGIMHIMLLHPAGSRNLKTITGKCENKSSLSVTEG